MATEHRLDDRLRRVYELLGDLVEETDQQPESDETPWYAPPLPPIEAGAKLSATDLLSCWFRPPTGRQSGWDRYFAGITPATAKKPADEERRANGRASPPAAELAAQSAQQALQPDPEDDLSTEDADQAVAVLYDFLHAFGRRDVGAAMEFVADDYHIVENDREVDRNELRCRLEWLLESLHGWDIEVSLASLPQPLSHPYGILIYSEIQIDAAKPGSDARSSVSERRVVLMEPDAHMGFKIAAMARPRL